MKFVKIFSAILIIAVIFVFLPPVTVKADDVSYSWAYRMGAGSLDRGNSMAVDASGNVYTAGVFGGTVDFDPSPSVFNLSSLSGSGGFIQKLDAQGNFIWAKAFTGNGATQITSMVIDTAGNIYTTGDFTWTTDFDPGAGVANLTSGGYNDIFVSKLDSSGNFIWAKSFSNAQYEYGRKLAVDSSGSVYITSSFYGTMDFDPSAGVANLSVVGYSDAFITKLDSSGNFVWAKSVGGSNYDYGYDLATDSSGNIYAVGSYIGTVDFDPGLGVFNMTSVSSSYDFYILKLDSSGNFVWAKSIGGSGVDDAKAIAITGGNIYITGSFAGADFDPGVGVAYVPTVSAKDIFVLKLDLNGSYVWAKGFGGGSNADEGQDILTDAVGNVYTTGYFYGTVDFDPGVGVANISGGGNTDAFVSKLDSSGNYVWAKGFAGPSLDEGYGLALDSSKNVYATGSFYSTVDFDPGVGVANLTSVGSADIYIVKLLAPIPPAVAELSITHIDKTEAELNGDLTNLGSSPVTTRGFEYGISPSYGTTVSESGAGFTTGSFAMTINGLTCGTQYYFRAFATSVVGTSHGSGDVFSTSGCVVYGSQGIKQKRSSQSSSELTQPLTFYHVGSNINIAGTIYRVLVDNSRSAYTSAGAFLSYKFNSWKEVLLPKSTDTVPESLSPYTPPRDGSLINDKGTVYLVSNGKRSGFVSNSVFTGMGYTYNFVRPGDTSFMQTLDPIKSASQKHPDGTLIKDNGTLYVMKNGARKGFPSMEVFNSWGYWTGEAVVANSYDLETQITGVVHSRTPDQLNL